MALRPAADHTFKGLLAQWPMLLSYAVSYLFVAIVWINHHYIMRFASGLTQRLLWINFSHLFSISLAPFSTMWMAESRLAPDSVAFYAAVFFLVNATYIGLLWEVFERGPVCKVSPSERRIMRVRPIATLGLHGAAVLIALAHPKIGLGICIVCISLYLRPDPPRPQRTDARSRPPPPPLVRR
jgi:uncharacterized membrane protein